LLVTSTFILFFDRDNNWKRGNPESAEILLSEKFKHLIFGKFPILSQKIINESRNNHYLTNPSFQIFQTQNILPGI